MRYTRQVLETCKDLGIELSEKKHRCGGGGCQKQRYLVMNPKFGCKNCVICAYGWYLAFQINQLSKLKEQEKK